MSHNYHEESAESSSPDMGSSNTLWDALIQDLARLESAFAQAIKHDAALKAAVSPYVDLSTNPTKRTLDGASYCGG